MTEEITLANIEALADGDVKFKNELLVAYVALFKEFFDEINFLVDSKKGTQLRETIHKVRSGVRILEANMLDFQLDKLDQAAKEGKLEQINMDSCVKELIALSVLLLSKLEDSIFYKAQNEEKS
jgi:hypothetical protein